ncbi:MAG: hypothetical protein IKW03_09330 [Clostridia bacterium]|nr:hypothetical protein [Clostridia bacterium]
MDVIYGRIFFALLATAGLVISIVLFVIHSEYRPGKSAQVRGYLKEANYSKDTYRGFRRAKKHYSHMTDCIYTYRVDGVSYEVTFSIPQKPHFAPKSVMVKYQIKHPKRACIGNDIKYLFCGFISLVYFLVFCGAFILTFFDI